MPNYCTNYLILGGNTEILTDLWEKNFAQLTFNQHGMFLQLLRPMPDLEDSEIRDWRLSNWGTKWEAIDMWDVNFDDDILTFEFDTAWSPPVEAVEYFCSWFGVHGRLISFDSGNFVGYYDSVSDKSCELEYNSHNVDMIIDALGLNCAPLKSQLELYHISEYELHIRNKSIEYLHNILGMVEDSEDEEESTPKSS